MINLLFCVGERRLDIDQIVSICQRSRFENQIFLHILCHNNHSIVTQKLSPSLKNVSVLVFPVKTKEDAMILSTLSALNTNAFLIVRQNATGMTPENIDALIEKLQSGQDVVMLKTQKPRNPLGRFFEKTYQKLCNVFFNFSFFEGDVGVAMFSATAHKIIVETEAINLTKLNRWVQIKVDYVEVPSQHKSLPHKTPISKKLWAVLWLALSLGTIFGIIFLGVLGKLGIVSFLLLLGAFVVYGLFFAHALLKLISFRQIGSIAPSKMVDFFRREP